MAQKFASYSPTTGAITGFYDSVDSPVPTGVTALAITDTQWQVCLANSGYTVANGALVAPSANAVLVTAQATKVATLSQACRATITNGFTSSALGSLHAYPSTPTDQQNLTDALMSAETNALWCEAAGVWSLVAHTVTQAVQVHTDWLTFRVAQQTRLVTITGQVNTTTTIEGVAAFGW
jgi:hypothetical protein